MLLLLMVIVSRLTAQADIVRTLEKVIHSSQSSKYAKVLAKPPSNVSGVCVPNKECSYSYLYKLRSHIGTQVS
jgi:hypothetical protein